MLEDRRLLAGILSIDPASASAGTEDLQVTMTLDANTSHTYNVVDTGQTTFYNNSSQISTPVAGTAFYGQDAQFEGNQPSYAISADGLTVYDDVTELTWTQGADWNGDGTLDANDKFSYADVQAYVETLNARNYGGFNDWRVPTIKELYSLIDYRGTDPNPTAASSSGLVPFIDDDVFEFGYGDLSAGERIIDSQWATSTLYVSTVMNGQQAMFGVNFADGRIKGYPAENVSGGISKTYYVRFVRGNTDYGTNDFAAAGDGTVTDQATGLMWSQDDSGVGMDWENALAWVQEMNAQKYLGHDDWRLPNAKELQSLVDYTRSPDTHGTAAIDPLFNATQIVNEAGEPDYPFYWSGTTFLRSDGSAASAVYVAFGEGLGAMDGTTVIDVHGAGCQRSDPKDGSTGDYPSWGNGPQGDVQRVFNYVRLVRDADDYQNRLPTAEAGGPYSGTDGDTIALSGAASTDSDGAIVAYAWDLDNDGVYDDATGATVNFAATTPGTFTVGLRVTDDDGATDTDTATITVSQQVEANRPPEVNRPIADHTIRPNTRLHLPLPPDTFIDPDTGQSLTYSAQLADGSPLPRWLAFDAQTQTFSGRPLARAVGQHVIQVTATDSGTPPLSAATEFILTVQEPLLCCQNTTLPQDVNGDSQATTLDVLILADRLNDGGSIQLAGTSPASTAASAGRDEVFRRFETLANTDDTVALLDLLACDVGRDAGIFEDI
jgi:hypothetical protein